MKILPVVVGTMMASALLPPNELHAQSCRGGIDFSRAAAQGQASVEVESASTLYGVSGGLGGTRYYGLASLAVRRLDRLGGSAFILGVGGGRIFQVPLTGKALNCFEVRGEFGTGPDTPGSIRADRSSSALAFELTTGVPLQGNGPLRFTPFGGLAARYESVVTQSDDNSFAITDFYELVTLGVGIMLNDDFSVQPYAQLPLGRDESDSIFGMRISMNFGSSSR